MDQRNKEQYANWKRQFLEDKRKAFEAEPGVYHLINMKRLFWRILAVYWGVHFILTIIFLVQMQADTNYVLDILRTLFQIFWLYVWINPEGTWRFNIVLYISAAYNLMTAINTYRQSLQGILPQIFSEMPLLGLIFLMEILIPFLLSGTACYLTLPKSHREQAERAQAIVKELQKEYKNKMIVN